MMKKLIALLTLVAATASFSSIANDDHKAFKKEALAVEQYTVYEEIKTDFGEQKQVLKNVVSGNTHYFHAMSDTSLKRWRSLVPVSALIEGVDTKTEGVQVEFVVNTAGQIVEVKHKDFVYETEHNIWLSMGK